MLFPLVSYGVVLWLLRTFSSEEIHQAREGIGFRFTLRRILGEKTKARFVNVSSAIRIAAVIGPGPGRRRLDRIISKVE